MRTQDNGKNRKFFSLPDIFVLGIVLLCTAIGFVLLFLPKAEGELYAEIKVHGELVNTVSLNSVSAPYEISVEGDLPVVLYVTPKGICFKESECPDRLCVNRGVISKSGESAVCLPAAVSLRIVAKNLPPSVDVVTG